MNTRTFLSNSSPNKHNTTIRLTIAKMLTTAATLAAMSIGSATASDDEIAAKGMDISQAVTQACYIDGLSEQLQCGHITVAENAEQPDGKQIDIHFAILPAIKNTYPNEAMLAIAGGPGQSAIENAATFDHMLNKVRQQRDILLIDQRGTGKSNLLPCDDIDVMDLSYDDDDINIAQTTQACLDAIEQNNPSDVRQYNSVSALSDFEAVRQHLGYSKLHLYGISYGTRMAQLYVRHFPEALATVTLDGIVPMQQSVLAIGGAIERAFTLLFSECQNTLACQQAYPNLEADYRAVDAKLANQGVTETVRNPSTNAQETLLMTRGKLNGAIRMGLYSPNIRALLPHAINEAANNNFQPVLGIYTLTADSTGIAMGMHSAVVCSEDNHRVTEQMRKDAKLSYFSATMLEAIEKTCDVWPATQMDDDFSLPIVSDLPTLLLSGELDPATPPNWGAMATKGLTNAKHFIAPYATHGVANQSCGNDIIADLVNSGSVDGLDAECLNKDVRRSFYLNANSVEMVPELTTEDKE